MRSRAVTSEYRNLLQDSRRWADFGPRADDVFIVTPPKCGTTWTQQIVGALLWPTGDAPAPGPVLSPWLDARGRPIDAVLAELEAQEHRRFIKSHAPLHGIPVTEGCRYLVVFRSTTDALVSWRNHQEGVRDEVWDMVESSAPGDGIEVTPRWDGTWEKLFDQWVGWQLSPPQQLAEWWAHRDDPDVMLLHYDGLSADLEGEMRRIAAFLALEVPEPAWPDVVDRCRFGSMKRQFSEEPGGMQRIFDRGADRFFHKGESGRGRRELPPELIARCDELDAHLPDDARTWLEHGRLGS